MSRPNTMFQDRDRDDVIPPSTTQGQLLMGGIELDVSALVAQWQENDKEFWKLIADMRLANAQKQLIPLETAAAAILTPIGRAAIIATHARKLITAKRVQERQKE